MRGYCKCIITSLILLSQEALAGPYVEAGLGVPLTPDSGYIPDQYGIFSFGYIHRVDKILSVDLGFWHRSLTGSDTGQCGDEKCYGDNTVEAKFRLEW